MGASVGRFFFGDWRGGRGRVWAARGGIQRFCGGAWEFFRFLRYGRSARATHVPGRRNRAREADPCLGTGSSARTGVRFDSATDVPLTWGPPRSGRDLSVLTPAEGAVIEARGGCPLILRGPVVVAASGGMMLRCVATRRFARRRRVAVWATGRRRKKLASTV